MLHTLATGVTDTRLNVLYAAYTVGHVSATPEKSHVIVEDVEGRGWV